MTERDEGKSIRLDNHIIFSQKAEREQKVMAGYKDSNSTIPGGMLLPSKAPSHEVM